MDSGGGVIFCCWNGDLGREVAPRLLLRCGLGREYDGRVDCVNWDRGRGRCGFGCCADDDCFALIWAGLGVAFTRRYPSASSNGYSPVEIFWVRVSYFTRVTYKT